ncbi:MAG TPA: hypothetical protein PLN38_08270 [Chitinophagales bacterium]|nr:hypothetical protein [Chitinophagales bacterium]
MMQDPEEEPVEMYNHYEVFNNGDMWFVKEVCLIDNSTLWVSEGESKEDAELFCKELNETHRKSVSEQGLYEAIDASIKKNQGLIES